MSEFTHVVVTSETPIYGGGPQGGEPPLAFLEAGTKVAFLEDGGITGHWRVRTEGGIVGDIAADNLRRLGEENSARGCLVVSAVMLAPMMRAISTVRMRRCL